MNREEVSNVSPLMPGGSDEQLVRAIRNGHVGASTLLYDRYVGHVRGVLTRVLGADSELPDLTNEVFFQALRSIGSLQDPDRLKAWITQVAVFTARRCIRSRKRRIWLFFLPSHELPEPRIGETSNDEAVDTVAAVRAVMSRMPADEQIVFSLRYMGAMEISEVAAACGVSERTTKRRLAGAESRFKALAAEVPELQARMAVSGKWRLR